MERPIVLVIEDNDPIQGLLDDALREAGFETGIVRTGEEAVTLLKGGLVRYRALVTDINLLGRFDGWEVARAAREVDPNIPVVYISGVAAAKWPEQGVPDSMMLQKPFCACATSDGALSATQQAFVGRSFTLSVKAQDKNGEAS